MPSIKIFWRGTHEFVLIKFDKSIELRIACTIARSRLLALLNESIEIWPSCKVTSYDWETGRTRNSWPDSNWASSSVWYGSSCMVIVPDLAKTRWFFTVGWCHSIHATIVFVLDKPQPLGTAINLVALPLDKVLCRGVIRLSTAVSQLPLSRV